MSEIYTKEADKKKFARGASKRLSNRMWVAALALRGRTYNEINNLEYGLATPAGIEPATTCLEGRCSIQLS